MRDKGFNVFAHRRDRERAPQQPLATEAVLPDRCLGLAKPRREVGLDRFFGARGGSATLPGPPRRRGPRLPDPR